VAQLEKRGIEFHSTELVHTNERGALTKAVLGGVMFELVHSDTDGLTPAL
jgi:4-hydroxyphenylpyruvate dioxygenase